MSDFKRSSSRFSRGSGSNGDSAQRTEGGASRGSFRSGGRSESRPSSGGSKTQGDFPFTRIGSLTVPKSASDEMADAAFELRGSDLKLNCQIYLGKGDEALTLKTGDFLILSFKVSEKDKEFVLGHVSVKN
jgi:hypothetical protein